MKIFVSVNKVLKVICHKKHILGIPVNLQTAKHQIFTFSQLCQGEEGEEER